MPTRLRCVVVGDNGSGKTSLLLRLQGGDPTTGEYLPSILDPYWLPVQSDGEDFELDMVDVNCDTTTEHEDAMHNSTQCARLRPLSLTGFGSDRGQPAWEGKNGKALSYGKGLPRAVALVCFADSRGLANAESIYVPEVKMHISKRCPWILLRLRDDADVATDELNAAAQAMAQRHGAVASCRCSAFTGRGSREAVDTAVRAWAIERAAVDAAVGDRRGKKCVIA